MHVLIDCTAIPANRGGVGRYIEGILRGFEQTDLQLTLVVQERDLAGLSQLVPWAHTHPVSRRLIARPLRIAWEQLGLPRLAKRLGADVIHSPHYTFPLAWRGGRVVTLHDATFFSDPEMHTGLKRVFFRHWIRRAWKRADSVLTPSAATAGEIERFLGSPRAYVQVSHLGVNSDRFYPPTPASISAFKNFYRLSGDHDWFAFLGTIEPRKNVPAVLNAYAKLRRRLGESAPRLLLAGGRGWDLEAVSMLEGLGREHGVHELGYIPIDHLPSLLGGARAVLYPSLGEGFGLPVLEAMACGAAVITTDRLAIPEVGGDAVLYVQPDAESILEGMHSLFHDEDERDRLGERAIERAALFTWSDTSRAHVDAYREAALN